ncbi:MAG: sulfite exporter TauE/SafE family protein [Pseudonocardia sp.]|nr:sulfite exporter TauE/SafE family protein [Pseudonocardia sp.]
MLILAGVLAIAVGLVLGLLGGGGSILTVPLLVYVAGMDAKQAITASLFVVGVTALAGLVAHARAGAIQWRTGLVFGASGMLGAFVGGMLGAHLPSRPLLGGFAVMMLAAATAMLRGRRGETRALPARARLPVTRVLPHGAAVGLVTGLVGAGGGFLIVPALVLFGGLSMPVAVGTSLLVIAMQSFAGLAGHLTGAPIAWLPTLAITAAAVLGAAVGGKLTGRIAPDALRRAFAWFVLAMGAVVLTQQLPADARWAALGTLGLVLLAALSCLVVRAKCPLRDVLTGRANAAREGITRHPSGNESPRLGVGLSVRPGVFTRLGAVCSSNPMS